MIYSYCYIASATIVFLYYSNKNFLLTVSHPFTTLNRLWLFRWPEILYWILTRILAVSPVSWYGTAECTRTVCYRKNYTKWSIIIAQLLHLYYINFINSILEIQCIRFSITVDLCTMLNFNCCIENTISYICINKMIKKWLKLVIIKT